MNDLQQLPGISLTELGERAELMTRVDRKYLVPLHTAHALIDSLHPGIRVLEIEGRRTFRYRSVYYDTSDLECFRNTAGKRRRRYKVRRRDYVDTHTSFLEVKTRTGRGESSKHRIPLDAEHPQAAQLSFVNETLENAGCRPPGTDLGPVLETTYDRTTLLHEDEGSRITLDADLTWSDPSGRTDHPEAGRGLQDLVVIETKAGQSPGTADRFLWDHGHRPTRLSKFATGMALLDPGLPSNRWHRTLKSVRQDAEERTLR